jgi:peptidoglycan/LPS O-acetylase OafA/YrhL
VLRDERLDFIRGFAVVGFVTAHFEAFTWLHFVFWERLGIFTGAELFVLVSGYLVGRVNREMSDREGSLSPSVNRVLARAFVLYRAYIVIIALVALLALSRIIDVTALTTFTDRWAAITYPLYPPDGTSWTTRLFNILLLRNSPHQVQILGLYVVLLAFSPLAFAALRRWDGRVVIAVSLGIWLLYQWHPRNLTGAQFEYAFPVLAWQIYFFPALAVGWEAPYELRSWMAKHGVTMLAMATPALLIAAAAFVFAQTTDNPSFPSGTRLDLLTPEQFRSLYDSLFVKNEVGPGRLLTAPAFLLALYVLLSRCWAPINRWLGWFFKPLGRASLYVFIVHLAFLAVVDQAPGYFDGNPAFSWATIWSNTAILVAILASLYVMVRGKVLFAVVPR